jgi:hypothetical protein
MVAVRPPGLLRQLISSLLSLPPVPPSRYSIELILACTASTALSIAAQLCREGCAAAVVLRRRWLHPASRNRVTTSQQEHAASLASWRRGSLCGAEALVGRWGCSN